LFPQKLKLVKPELDKLKQAEKPKEVVDVLINIAVILMQIKAELPLVRFTYDEVRRAMISRAYWRDSIVREVPVDVGANEVGTATIDVTPDWVWLPNKLQLKFGYDRSFNFTGYVDDRKLTDERPVPDLKLSKAARPIDVPIECHKPMRLKYILDYEEIGGFADNWFNVFLYACMVKREIYDLLEKYEYESIVEWLRVGVPVRK